ncbi:oxidoreductase [Vibrio renipiscarius]|uniref:oxidoreductase n=1 Tax=Vibrio renipiscarius TaxID=1461322 RepID=UPI00354F63ED
MSKEQVVIIAGATGLIGTELLKLMLAERAIDHIYALTRKGLAFTHPKLEEIRDSELRILDWDDTLPTPEKGYICLGTTRKQAGSKSALEAVDYHLVCDVAKNMALLGVKHLTVVSSYGANPRSSSHYLRCKGKMELALENLGFEHVTFVQPGPLVGLRDTPRSDETILQGLLKILRPIMIGRLARFIPIKAELVARAMLYASFASNPRPIEVFDSVAMRELLNKYK